MCNNDYFLCVHQDGALVATGSTVDMNADRVILKRVVLTGYPIRSETC
jgi:hypothetical protein